MLVNICHLRESRSMVPEDLVSQSEDLEMKMRCRLGCYADEGIIEKRGGDRNCNDTKEGKYTFPARFLSFLREPGLIVALHLQIPSHNSLRSF